MGSTETGLERIRTRLLDLTNRNKLLNFRHSAASTLRVVEVNLNSVFRRVMDGEKLRFIPVPEPDDLGQTPTPHGSLPVLHYRQPLDTLTRKPEHQVEHVGSDALNRCNDETSRLSPVFRTTDARSQRVLQPRRFVRLAAHPKNWDCQGSRGSRALLCRWRPCHCMAERLRRRKSAH